MRFYNNRKHTALYLKELNERRLAMINNKPRELPFNCEGEVVLLPGPGRSYNIAEITKVGGPYFAAAELRRADGVIVHAYAYGRDFAFIPHPDMANYFYPYLTMFMGRRAAPTERALRRHLKIYSQK